MAMAIIYDEQRKKVEYKSFHRETREFIFRSPLTYYGLISDLFTSTFHASVLKKSNFLADLKKRKDNYLHDITADYSNGLKTAMLASEERDDITKILDDSYENQLVKLNGINETLTHDINTLTRQSRINRDQVLRCELKKKILCFSLICACLFIFVSYSGDFGLDRNIRLFLFTLIILFFAIKLILYYLDYIRRHNLDYNYRDFKAYSGKAYPGIKNDGCSNNDDDSGGWSFWGNTKKKCD
jgi:uncharacterized membrane protein